MNSSSRRSVSRKERRQNPLSEDIIATGPLRTKSSKRKAKQLEEEDDKYVDSRSTRKILKIGHDLLEEEKEENHIIPPNRAFLFESRFGEDDGLDFRNEDDEDDEDWGDEEDDGIEDVEADPTDLNIFNKIVPDRQPQPIEEEEKGINLADIILEKIAFHEAAHKGESGTQGGTPDDVIELPAKVIEVYSKIGLLLSRYKSGKLPKPFKIIPSLPQWEELLSITRPESWSSNACYEATKVFVSSTTQTVQRFLESVILDRVREDIHETKKLNVHLYKALKKSLYKPAAFFKGFLFPLISSGTCTLREAHIIGSVLVRVSVPVLHSAAALLRLTEIAAEQTSVSAESAGATNVFIRVLLEKKYALPYKVIDSLVFHFLRFRVLGQGQGQGSKSLPLSENLGLKDQKLPVLWHQCLLAFAQRYRNDITEDQREALLDLLLGQGHKQIGPEVRRELLQGRGRGMAMNEGGDDGGDDTMVIDHT